MSNRERVLKVLAGRKTPLTIKDIAAKSGVTIDTTRRQVSALLADGAVVVDGFAHTGRRGRPSPLYRAAA